MDKTLEQEIRQILTETCRGEIHAATASILTLIAAARPAVVSDEVVELTADFARGLPGGKLDDSDYEAIESALDRADAPCQGSDGHWLTLAERVAALALLPGVEGEGSSRSLPSRTPCDLWRDISTAPKDGKPILLGWLELGWVGEGRFIEDAGWFEAGAHPTDHTDGEVWPDLWMSMPELPLRVAGPCVLHPHSDEKDAGENDQSREEQNPSASPKEVR